ncbi:hypothetical protein C3K47_03525 [Solitalea longa]|uniref:Uncharacterized protein n=1 Tax=Solitalea longa TaxID=2079460 RepID=A0A2S5A7H2_9SPHI|nr:hypothetical protein [Solitalea longa]POY38476.1 hypothetical protein C3K47_03525 [Solitalea longa]
MHFLEYIGFLLLSSVKFFFFYPVFITKENYNFFEAMTFGLTSGFIGTVTFTFFGDLLYKFFHNLKLKREAQQPSKQKSPSVKQRRWIIKLRNGWGLWGIALLSPVLITIPFGCFLATRYYHNKHKILGHFMLAIAFWSAFIFLFKSAIVGLVS